MIDGVRGPSRIVTVLQVFSSASIDIVLCLGPRSVVRSDRLRAGQKSVQKRVEVADVWLV